VVLLTLLGLFFVIEARHVIFNRAIAPKDWSPKTKPAETDLVKFHLALRHKNFNILQAKAFAVSDPMNEDYGNYLSINEILDIVATPEEDVKAIINWIKTANHHRDLKKIINRRDALIVITTVRHAEEIFATEFRHFVNVKTGKTVIRNWGEFSVPEHLNHAIHIVTGVADFPIGKKHLHVKPANIQNPEATNACNVPYSMLNLYNQTQNLTITNTSVSQAPYSQIEAAKEGFGYSDYIKFDQLNGLVNYPVTCIIGDAADKYYNRSDDGEATLDIQMETSFGLGAKTCFWVMTEWMYNFANEIFSTQNAPLVNSISYGWPEFQSCDGTILQDNCSALGIPNSKTYVERTEEEFAKIAARGLTVIASSGDTGSPGDSNDDCSNVKFPLGPAYPTTSVWITSVGATDLKNTGSVTTSLEGPPPICSNANCVCSTSTDEVAAVLGNSGFTTGGGFSMYNLQPSWQVAAVSKYLASNATMPNKTVFNASLRAFPDISALGNNILNIVGGQVQLVGGTSASCPIIGGMVSQLNNWRLNNNLPAIGHFAPLIYQIYAANPKAFRDITVGSTACTEEACCPGLGFTCTVGWDPATGVGTPNFGVIMNYVQNMQMPKRYAKK